MPWLSVPCLTEWSSVIISLDFLIGFVPVPVHRVHDDPGVAVHVHVTLHLLDLKVQFL
jgi:hypothetical protein